MAALPVTVVVIPHERFGAARASLASILEHTPEVAQIIYIDAGSPPLVRQYLEQRAARQEIKLISTERFVSPNQARNLALNDVDTQYVAFVDNDIEVSAGWLDSLVACAEQLGAAVVGSVCCQSHRHGAHVIASGGAAEISELGGRRTFRQHDELVDQAYPPAASMLRRQAVGQVGLQATLVRTSTLATLGPFDESLLSGAQHVDLCLGVRGLGQSVVLEASCVVHRLDPPPFEPGDLEYFQLRWSDAWNRATLAHFAAKWQLPANDPGLLELGERLDMRRRITLEPYRRILRLLGNTPATWFERVLIAPLEQVASRRRVPAVPDTAEKFSDNQPRRAA